VSGLTVHGLQKGYGPNPVLRGIDLDVADGSFTAILGPSGSGKTTLLRVLAGFDRADRGQVRIGSVVVDSGRTFVPPHRRQIGYVPQEGALFPHLTVAGNVGFGLRRGRPRDSVVDGLLDMLGLDALARRYPHQLSGGQQQRVALARALAIGPRVVLLDEPFTSLDASLRATVRTDVAQVLRRASTTTLLVTHDQDEALSMADSVAVLRDGVIAQAGPPEQLYARPVDVALARFLGDANVVDGVAAGRTAVTRLGRVHLGVAPGSERVVVLLRPEQLEATPVTERAGSEVDGGLPGMVVACEYFGHDAVLRVRTDGAPGLPDEGLLVRVSGPGALAPGTAVLVRAHGEAMAWAADLGPQNWRDPVAQGVQAQ
jgi:iron(III) transport system ATP-binding protein